ncbi:MULTISPECIES: iron ABC transporter permease [unclassified Ensifer]|uniref:ABC transporter permease n=1 Tax=unclassified Ensifer TaxID=2633371 RepID=UPI0008135E44|nr:MULTISPECIES: iron ABC transporter permease [unclassified Ensifer]OCP03090.1 iron ABC transporter permease [Ensifer sp. LC14]OCP08211.1 iron ABC transporter permease [Ensifer sp. LC11]OCP08885.1 iron ABC transporter permease [Ensifer sp. LC13]OCP32255.1 iron ABC transporter permease [Ensifer sp. LC499]
MKKTTALWLALGMAGYVLLPWYRTETGIFDPTTLAAYFSGDLRSGLAHMLFHGRWWLVAPLVGFTGSLIVLFFIKAQRHAAIGLVSFAALGLALTALQGVLVVASGSHLLWLVGTDAAQESMGIGALLSFVGLLFTLTTGISGLGNGRGDAFICGLIGAIVASVGVFVFYPVSHVLVRAFELPGGAGYGLAEFLPSLFSAEIWGVRCLVFAGSCGAGTNSLLLALMTGLGTTVLGLAFALIFTRTNFKAKGLLRALTIIPIITPPFVIGLALILLFGRSGTVTNFFADVFALERTRWLYGFWGVYLAQVLSFTPIAFLVLIGVVEGVSPSMEEASQTLDADRWQTFRYVSLPLMRPGLANAFLLGFIESLADFGNPLVLGGNFNVLSTEIYFAIVGAVADPARAAILSIALLLMTLGAFLAQRRWVGKKSYTTVTGKADSGRHAALNPGLKAACYALALPWAAFTAIVYSMIAFGSLVKLWGYDHTFTFAHYARAFAVGFNNGVRFTGSAWDSFFTTLGIAAISAPLTALLGLATAYLLVRQRFFGKTVFEFSTMLSFAIPGTVIGVAYVMAFNFPPIELTGTAMVLVIVFVFRNMPVGVRGGIAAMSQLDKSLDEASTVLGANSFTTARRVLAPLLGPAILAAVTYSFVRSITSVSAVIFLVSARYNMATSFIVGRVENGDFGVAIAYSAVLILTMLAAILTLQFAIGQRRLRRTNRLETA